MGIDQNTRCGDEAGTNDGDVEHRACNSYDQYQEFSTSLTNYFQ